jgi:hypothetical protein
MYAATAIAATRTVRENEVDDEGWVETGRNKNRNRIMKPAVVIHQDNSNKFMGQTNNVPRSGFGGKPVLLPVGLAQTVNKGDFNGMNVQRQRQGQGQGQGFRPGMGQGQRLHEPRDPRTVNNNHEKNNNHDRDPEEEKEHNDNKFLRTQCITTIMKDCHYDIDSLTLERVDAIIERIFETRKVSLDEIKTKLIETIPNDIVKRKRETQDDTKMIIDEIMDGISKIAIDKDIQSNIKKMLELNLKAKLKDDFKKDIVNKVMDSILNDIKDPNTQLIIRKLLDDNLKIGLNEETKKDILNKITEDILLTIKDSNVQTIISDHIKSSIETVLKEYIKNDNDEKIILQKIVEGCLRDVSSVSLITLDIVEKFTARIIKIQKIKEDDEERKLIQETVKTTVERILKVQKEENENNKLIIQSTVINVLISFAPRLRIGQCNFIKRFKKLIDGCIKKSRINNKTTNIKDSTGFGLINSLCWPAQDRFSPNNCNFCPRFECKNKFDPDKYIIERDFKIYLEKIVPKEYIESMTFLASLINLLETNKRGETPFQSYSIAVDKYYAAPRVNEIFEILKPTVDRDQLNIMIKDVVNKINKNFSVALANKLKLVLIKDMDLFMTKLFGNMCTYSDLDKKSNYFEQIGTLFDVLKEMIYSPIDQLKSTEDRDHPTDKLSSRHAGLTEQNLHDVWKLIVEPRFSTNEQKEQFHKTIMVKIINAASLQMENTFDSKDFTPRSRSSIGIVSAVIAEVTAILDDKLIANVLLNGTTYDATIYTTLVLKILNYQKRSQDIENLQNIILTMIAQFLKRLTKDNKKHAAEKYITVQVFDSIAENINILVPRISTCLKDVFDEFLEIERTEGIKLTIADINKYKQFFGFDCVSVHSTPVNRVNPSLQNTKQTNATNLTNPKNQMNPINPVKPMNPMNPMNQTNPMSPIGLMNPMGPISPINQSNSTSEIRRSRVVTLAPQRKLQNESKNYSFPVANTRFTFDKQENKTEKPKPTKPTEQEKKVTEKVIIAKKFTLDDLGDLDTFSGYSPLWLVYEPSKIICKTKAEQPYDPKVTKWIEKCNEVKNNPFIHSKVVISIILGATNEVIQPTSMFVIERLTILKDILDNIFGSDKIKLILEDLLNTKNESIREQRDNGDIELDEIRALWETKERFDTFKTFLCLYDLTY